jgi:hypothetical protein
MTEASPPDAGPIRPLPGWSQLPSQTTDPDLPPVESPEPEGIRIPTSGSPDRPRKQPSPPQNGEPVTTLSGRSPSAGDAREIGKVISGLVKLITGVVAKLVASRGGVFRRPSEVECNDIGQPLGRIVARHSDFAGVPPDLIDAASATAAVSEYLLADAPLITRAPEWREPDPEDPQP